MAKQSNQKLKLLYLWRILMERTDEEHPMTTAELISALEGYGVPAERKSIYADLEALELFGLDIVRNRRQGCYVGERPFQLAELKLLVDAVQSSRFITHRKSEELIKKVEGLASVHQARALQRQVYVANRIKTMNESIYYNVDKVHSAISAGKKITFHYFEWTCEGKKRLRHSGKLYRISPWALTWDDENYYMIGFDSKRNGIRHYRVDKMQDISITRENRDGQEHFECFDMAVYSKKMFGMFNGREETVRLRFANRLAGVVIDRFGRDIPMTRSGPEHFVINLQVAVSPQFLSWLFAFGADVTVLSPDSVIDQLRQQAQAVLGQYQQGAPVG